MAITRQCYARLVSLVTERRYTRVYRCKLMFKILQWLTQELTRARITFNLDKKGL